MATVYCDVTLQYNISLRHDGLHFEQFHCLDSCNIMVITFKLAVMGVPACSLPIYRLRHLDKFPPDKTPPRTTPSKKPVQNPLVYRSCVI